MFKSPCTTSLATLLLNPLRLSVASGAFADMMKVETCKRLHREADPLLLGDPHDLVQKNPG